MTWNLCLCESCEKTCFSRPDFVDLEVVIWGLTYLTDFYKRVHLFLEKVICVILPNGNLFCSNYASENYIFNSWRHQVLFLVANQFQDSTFLFEIKLEQININNSKSQLKLLLSSNCALGLQLALKKTTSLFFAKLPPLKSANCPRSSL